MSRAPAAYLLFQRVLRDDPASPAPAEYGSYQEARTGKVSQIEVSALSGNCRALWVPLRVWP